MNQKSRRFHSLPCDDSGDGVSSTPAAAGPPRRKGGTEMARASTSPLRHPVFTRRDALQAGSLGLLGLSLADLQAAPNPGRPKSVIYIFLSGGLSQHESFDPKP